MAEVACTDCPVFAGDTVTITLTVRDCDDDSIIDLSSATAQNIVIQGPTANTRLSEVSAFPAPETGVEGRITATFAAGRVRALGEWKVQGNVTLSSGAYHTTKACFDVEDPL